MMDYVHKLGLALDYSRNYEVCSMGVGAGLYMYDVIVKFTFAISSHDEFLCILLIYLACNEGKFLSYW